MTTTEAPDLIGRIEVAKILNVTPATVTRWVRLGKLRTVGNRRRCYVRAEIVALATDWQKS